MKLFCYIGLHSWGYRGNYFRACYHCHRGQSRGKQNGLPTTWQYVTGEY